MAGAKIPQKQTSCFDWKDKGETIQDEFLAVHAFKSVFSNAENQRHYLEEIRDSLGNEVPEYRRLLMRDEEFYKILDSIYFKLSSKQFYSSNRSRIHKNISYSKGHVVHNDWLLGMFEHSCKPNVCYTSATASQRKLLCAPERCECGREANNCL